MSLYETYKKYKAFNGSSLPLTAGCSCRASELRGGFSEPEPQKTDAAPREKLHSENPGTQIKKCKMEIH